MKNKIIGILVIFLLPFLAKAQELMAEPEMADAFRSNGKIYVVISVLAIVFISIIAYLIYIDLKLKRLEKRAEVELNSK